MRPVKPKQWTRYGPAPIGTGYVKGKLGALVSLDNGLWHMSVSHESRNPTWEEIRDAWYELVPDAENITGVMVFPPKAEYVNLHPHCFHIYQTRVAP